MPTASNTQYSYQKISTFSLNKSKELSTETLLLFKYFKETLEQDRGCVPPQKITTYIILLSNIYSSLEVL